MVTLTSRALAGPPITTRGQLQEFCLTASECWLLLGGKRTVKRIDSGGLQLMYNVGAIAKIWQFGHKVVRSIKQIFCGMVFQQTWATRLCLKFLRFRVWSNRTVQWISSLHALSETNCRTSLLWRRANARNVSQHTLYGVEHIHHQPYVDTFYAALPYLVVIWTSFYKKTLLTVA